MYYAPLVLNSFRQLELKANNYFRFSDNKYL